MRRFVMAGLAVAALAVTPSLRARAFEPPEAKPKAGSTPKQQFQTVLDEYQKAQQEFSRGYAKAKTDAERNTLYNEKSPKPLLYAERFLAIAETNPDDPAGVDALVWAVRLGGGQGKTGERVRKLVEAHAESPKIAGTLGMLANSYTPWVEGVIRTVAAKNPDRAARGQATLTLGRYLKDRAELVRGLRDDPGRLARVEPFLATQGYDHAAIARLKSADPDAILKEVETLFEKVAADYGDVSGGRGTLGKVATGELNEIRNLGIGKPCPEIAGDDIDGKPFKLSDYRGKVVVVDFWGDW